MTTHKNEEHTIALVGRKREAMAALINLLVDTAYNARDNAPPVQVLLFNQGNEEQEGFYPFLGSVEDLHPFDADTPPQGFPTFAEYIEEQFEPALWGQLLAPDWQTVDEYMGYVLDLAVEVVGESAVLGVGKSALHEIQETNPGEQATLVLVDGSRLEVSRVIRGKQPLHMATIYRETDSATPSQGEEEARHAARQRVRDWFLIKAGTLSFPLPGENEPPVLWTHLSDYKPYCDDLPTPLDLAPVPYLIPEKTPQGAESEGMWSDPPHTGTAIPYLDVLRRQANYVFQLDTQADHDRAFQSLLHITQTARTQHGFVYAQDLIGRLHRHRWVPGAWPSATLRIEGYGGFGNPFLNRANNPAYISDRIKDLMGRIDRAKQDVTSLTQWAEALYLLSPEIQALLLHLKVSEVAKAEDWHRYFTRVNEDITRVHRLNSDAVMRRYLGAAASPSWTTTYLTHLRTGKSAAEYRQQLKHLYEDRVTIPGYWHDAASSLYDTADSAIPRALDTVDPYRAVSLDVLEFWSLQWSRLPGAEGFPAPPSR